MMRELLLTLFIVALVSPLPVFGGSSCTEGLAKTEVIEGQVEVRRGGSATGESVRTSVQLCAGDTLITGNSGRATLRMKNSTVVRVDHNSSLTLSGVSGDRPALVDLLKGTAYFFSRTPRPFSIRTPFANAHVEGTEFQIREDGGQAEITLFEGELLLKNDSGEMRLGPGEACLARSGFPLERIVRVRPLKAVQWAMYYPPLFGSGLERGIWGRLLDLLVGGDDEKVLAQLGQSGIKGSPAANLLAIQAIAALVQNRGEEAADLAREAARRFPSENSPMIAMSYVLQGRGDMAGALQSLKEVLAKEPRNAIALARYAELLLINGETGRSREAAMQAIEIDQSVDSIAGITGFTLLAQRKPAEAEEAFRGAIAGSPGAPMPHLGLGISLIALRWLEAGREQIELAAALDPSDSLLRSYLGRAYIEEGRYPEAVKQLGLAKDLDPADPTPLLYSAFVNYTLSDPVNALADMERSIERNDNRLVYRSRYLLDQDLAVRLTSLARIYEALGFSSLALSEGARGVTLDPDSPAAHRFLSDSYSSLPRHQIARVSELLQSQLLNPLGADALQPHIHESRLGVTESGIQSSLGYNEYASLFGRRGVTAQISGIAGSDHLLGEELVITGNGPRWTLSAGQFHQQTDGFRPNSDYDQDIYRFFAQGVLNPQASVQTEYRYRSFDRGDIDVRFDPSDYLPYRRQEDTTSTFRLGGRYALSQDASFILSLMYGRGKYLTDDVRDGSKMLGLNLRDDAYDAELQSILRYGGIRVVSGAAALTLDRKDGMEIPLIMLSEVRKSTVEFYSLYGYATVSFPGQLNLILGLSGDLSNGGTVDRSQINPKAGIVWNPAPETTVRAAAFRTLKRPLIGDQTIEPTNVAGFNQLYDDYEMTSAWRYGIGVDRRFGQRLFIVSEYAWRDLDVPVNVAGEVESVTWEEKWGRVYVNAVLHPLLSVSAEYRYERYERDDQYYSSLQKLTTHTLPLALHLHYPNGLSASVSGSYYDQSGVFNSNTTGETYSGSDRFWLLDASVGYRLPGRLGTLSIEGKNLADTAFNYHDMDPWSPTIRPGRQVMFRCSLTF